MSALGRSINTPGEQPRNRAGWMSRKQGAGDFARKDQRVGERCGPAGGAGRTSIREAGIAAGGLVKARTPVRARSGSVTHCWPRHHRTLRLAGTAATTRRMAATRSALADQRMRLGVKGGRGRRTGRQLAMKTHCDRQREPEFRPNSLSNQRSHAMTQLAMRRRRSLKSPETDYSQGKPRNQSILANPKNPWHSMRVRGAETFNHHVRSGAAGKDAARAGRAQTQRTTRR
jgi:hypothetical protein